MENANKCLNKLSYNNLVKKFIMKELEGEIIKTARLDSHGANILKTVKLKETYLKKKIYTDLGSDILQI